MLLEIIKNMFIHGQFRYIFLGGATYTKTSTIAGIALATLGCCLE